MMLDVYADDLAFGVTQLTKAINLVPYQPTRIQRLGWFGGEGISTTSVLIEMQNEVFKLVPNRPRGAPGTPKNLERRNVRPFMTTHLPQVVALMADEVQNLRAFGSQTDTELATARLNKKLVAARRDLDLTIEYQRMGALKGVVLDADGSTVLLNLFTEFGVTQQEQDMALDVDTTRVIIKILEMKRMMEAKLGAVMYSGIRVLCSSGFFDSFVSHPLVEKTYAAQQGQFLRNDNRSGFAFGECWWEEYNGSVNGTPFIEANCAYAVPEGVPDLMTTYYAPAPYMETVNTEGLPYYASREMMEHNKGIEVETQSNPLHLVTRPNAIIKLGKNAAALA